MIWTIIEFEKDIIMLNNVTKFHKILLKTIRLRERTLVSNGEFSKTKGHNS